MVCYSVLYRVRQQLVGLVGWLVGLSSLDEAKTKHALIEELQATRNRLAAAEEALTAGSGAARIETASLPGQLASHATPPPGACTPSR